MPEYLSAETFRPYVDTMFLVADETGQKVELRLQDVAPLPARDTDAAGDGLIRSQPFSLLFVGPHAIPLSQGIHQMEHSDLMDVVLFLVPVGPGHDGLCYEAIFN